MHPGEGDDFAKIVGLDRGDHGVVIVGHETPVGPDVNRKRLAGDRHASDLLDFGDQQLQR